MNPSTAQASVIVDELVRNGVRHVVACPGSRNAALTMALADAADAGALELHVRVDERGAGYLALGLAKVLAAPVAVCCTSGTAVANLHPAVLEAYHSGVGLMVITADRPPELHGTGANQTIDQGDVFGPAAVGVQFPVAEAEPAGAARAGLPMGLLQNAVWRGLVCRAVAQAQTGRPVQVNVPFREPLVPTGDGDWPSSLAGRDGGLPWTTSAAPRSVAGSRIDFRVPARTLMVVGSGSPARARAAAAVAAAAGWPVVAEPSGIAAALAGGAPVLRCGALLLATGALPDRLRPDAVVVVGRPTLSRGVRGLMGQAPVYGVGDHPQWTDPQYVAQHVRGWLDESDMSYMDEADPGWLADWLTVDTAAASVVDKQLGAQPWPTGLQVAADVVAALPAGALLFLGSSNPIRDVDLVAEPRADLEVHANRGVAGIDGNVSAAVGAALGVPRRPCYALIGDLTFLHDLNGLLIGPTERRPDLTVVVVNDDGGGIFSLLEQGERRYAGSFERVFGTPHGADLAALCAGYRTRHTLVTTPDELREALAPGIGLRVVEVRTDRTQLRELHARLRAGLTAITAD